MANLSGLKTGPVVLLLPRPVPILLNRCVCAGNCVIHRINRARCALNMEILDLLNEESVSGAHSGRASL